MAFTIKTNEKIAIVKETTQGTYAAPSASDYVLPLADGIELNPAKELLERDILTPNIGRILPRTGIRSVSGSIGLEAKASETEGAVPEQGPLTEAALGPVRSVSTIALPSQEFLDGATSLTKLSGDDIEVNDIILIKFSGAYHLSPITAVTTTTATMLVPIIGAKATAVYSVSAFTNYKGANSGQPSLSITKEIESDLVEEGLGCRVSSMSLENFTTGQLPTHTYALEGLNYDWKTGGAANSSAASYDSSLPPVILQACVYQDASRVIINELAFTVENTIGNISSTCDANGNISSRITAREISGTFNPYKTASVDSDQTSAVTLDQFNKFNNNIPYSLFAYAYNPKLSSGTVVAGEFEEVIAYWLPSCLSTEIPEGDSDDVLQYNISFIASAGNVGANVDGVVSYI